MVWREHQLRDVLLCGSCWDAVRLERKRSKVEISIGNNDIYGIFDDDILNLK